MGALTTTDGDVVDEQRFGEIDDLLRPVNTGVALAVAGAAAFFWDDYGAVFVAFCLLPIAWWSSRLIDLHDTLGLEAWNIVLVLVISATIAGGSSASGGQASPALFFAGLVGLFVQMLWPSFRFPAAIGVSIVVVVVGYDLVGGEPLRPFALIAVVLMTLYLPIAARQIVIIEHLHRRRAVLDTLTGCLNRRSLEDRTPEIEQQAQRLGTPVAVVLFDIDHFKHVNDQHGHTVGDRVLEHVAYVTRKELRRLELMFRVGGEEFLVVLPGSMCTEAADVAERLRRSIERAVVDGVSVSASFGVVAAHPPVSIASLLDEADRRLYLAKGSGRNRVVAESNHGPDDHSDVFVNDSLRGSEIGGGPDRRPLATGAGPQVSS